MAWIGSVKSLKWEEFFCFRLSQYCFNRTGWSFFFYLKSLFLCFLFNLLFKLVCLPFSTWCFLVSAFKLPIVACSSLSYLLLFSYLFGILVTSLRMRSKYPKRRKPQCLFSFQSVFQLLQVCCFINSFTNIGYFWLCNFCWLNEQYHLT